MTGYDAVGLAGVLLILVAYALTVGGRIDARGAPALAANFLGAAAILVSLMRDFNLSAAVMEGAWAAVALGGLIRLAFKHSR